MTWRQILYDQMRAGASFAVSDIETLGGLLISVPLCMGWSKLGEGRKSVAYCFSFLHRRDASFFIIFIFRKKSERLRVCDGWKFLLAFLSPLYFGSGKWLSGNREGGAGCRKGREERGICRWPCLNL